MDYDEAWRKFGLRWQELAIISGVVAGYTDREIADQLGFGVEYYLSSAFDKLGKLGLSTRKQLARFAVQHALPLKIPLEKPQVLYECGHCGGAFQRGYVATEFLVHAGKKPTPTRAIASVKTAATCSKLYG
jgi:DNA-binding CsgD family transcriptional regulator